MTFDLFNIWKNPYCIFDPTLVWSDLNCCFSSQGIKIWLLWSCLPRERKKQSKKQTICCSLPFWTYRNTGKNISQDPKNIQSAELHMWYHITPTHYTHNAGLSLTLKMALVRYINSLTLPHGRIQGLSKFCSCLLIYDLIAFDPRVTFGFDTSGHCGVCVYVCCIICTYCAHTHTMQQTHTHKAVTGHVEKVTLSSKATRLYRHICWRL